MRRRALPKHIEDIDLTEPGVVIVTLAWGWSYESRYHEAVRGFDTMTEALRASARKRVYPCDCEDCRDGKTAVAETTSKGAIENVEAEGGHVVTERIEQ